MSVQFNILSSSQFIFWGSCLKLSMFLSLKNLRLLQILRVLVFSFESCNGCKYCEVVRMRIFDYSFLRYVLKMQFIKVMSVSVVLESVTLVGLLIKAIDPFSNSLFKNYLISEIWWNSKQFRLKSPETE